MRTLRIAAAILCCWAPTARAQAQDEAGGAAPRPIQDNSFLLEEAYNQEPGIVQHISLFHKDLRSGEWIASFTQEWPVGGLRNQLSYTVSYLRIATESGGFTGFGDFALNYRYQLVGDGEARLAVAPRITVFFPSGSSRKGLGQGGVGLQLGIPASFEISERFVAHGNVGFTRIFSAENSAGDSLDISAGSAGGSLIWLWRSNLNLMLETFWARAQAVSGPDRRRIESVMLVSPGVRWSYDFRSGLQIVPGIAVPVGVGPSHGRYGVLLYLSFEHPMWSASAR
jgi:hypothetical protein